MKLEIAENLGCAFEWCILNTQKVWSSNKFKKMKSLCKRWVLVRNAHTSREIVRFVEVHQVFVVTLSTPLHMLCGWNDDTMPSFDIFRVHFAVIFNFTVIWLSKQIGKWLKNSKWCQNMLKIDDLALNGAYGMQKKSGVQISLKKWSARVTDEFSFETLLLRERLSVLYTKCQFLP